MDVEISETKTAGKKLVLTSSGLGLYVKSLLGVGAYYSVNNVTISESRNFVEHTMPGRKGSVFQDMGRPAIKVTIEGNIAEDGIYYGLSGKGKNTIMLEELHKLCDAGNPVDFLCDMPALFGVSRVIIQELEATEVKGRKHNYNYKLTLKEWSEPAMGSDALRNKYVESMKKDAKIQLLKKGVVAGAAAGVVVTYMAVTTVKTNRLVIKLDIDKRVVTAEEAVDIKASVNDSKGDPVADADVTIKQDTKELFSGKTNAEGIVSATFQSPDAGNYTVTATAVKSDYGDGEASATVTVDTRIKARLSTDKATIKTTGKANIKVTAADCNGKAIEGATIELACTGATLEPASGSADSQGAFTASFSSTTAGSYEVKATVKKSPYADGNANVTIKVIT
ncbi:Ig-like domain-containing protein [Methanocella paludicola]|nr:Ig-like domain-containing protein [Methanocella paludicola]